MSTVTWPFDADKLIEICRRHDVMRVGVFGSTARGEMHATSDIDLLVTFSTPKSLLSIVSLEQQLSDALERKVDVVTDAAVSPYLRDHIMRDLQIIYET